MYQMEHSKPCACVTELGAATRPQRRFDDSDLIRLYMRAPGECISDTRAAIENDGIVKNDGPPKGCDSSMGRARRTSHT